MQKMARMLSATWWQRHHEAVLTAVPLLIMLIGGYPSRQIGWQWEMLLIALAWLPLIVRNRWPALVLAVVSSVETISIAVAGHAHPPQPILPAATMLALYTVSVRWPGRQAWTVAATVGIVQFAVAVTTPSTTARDLLYLNWAIVSTAVGQLIRERRLKLAAADQRAVEAERGKEAEAQRRVIAERMRIAHELHDVLAHHIAVVNAQAGVAQYLLESDPAAANKALSGITTNSRAALDELRITLGLLRGEADAEGQGGRLLPAPTIEHLDRLIRPFTQAGMDLSVDIHGSPCKLSTAAESALTRTIQEALTNASKHAPGSAVVLELDWSSNPVRLSVMNERPSCEGPLMNEGTGHGLIGMRERAAIANGSVITGPTPEGGFKVLAMFPRGDVSADGATTDEAASGHVGPRDEPTTP